MNGPGLKKALLQERVGDRVRCLTCERRCLLQDGALGWCRTRRNEGGTLYTLIYGLVSSLSANPIEKKPLYHFYPGSVALTAGSWSCNFDCPWCIAPDTEVLLEHGHSIRIEELKARWAEYEVVTCDWPAKTLGSSPITHFLELAPEKQGAQVLEITTRETGRRITATADHPFYTPLGPTPLGKLRNGDRVAVYPSCPIPLERMNEALLLSTDAILQIVAKHFPRTDIRRLVATLEAQGLLPLTTLNRKLPILARLLGTLFGDGTISISHRAGRDVASVRFCGAQEDLRQIRQDLETLGFRPSRIITRQKSSAIFRYGEPHLIVGSTSEFACDSKALCALMIALGAPIGDKTTTECHLPDWLMQAPSFIQREFVAALLGSELTGPRVDKWGKNFLQPKFSLHKADHLLGNGLAFANALRELLARLGVAFSKPRVVKGSVRKDGTKTSTIYFLALNSLDNLLRLFGGIGYRYCRKREALARYATEYLLMKNYTLARRREALRQAKIFKERGLSPIEIYREVNPNLVHYGNLVRWLRIGQKPESVKLPLDFPKFQDWLKAATQGLQESGLVWETIADIQTKKVQTVYDLTVARNAHTFFANGFLVSNCQNWDISKRPPSGGRSMSAEEFVAQAIAWGCQGTSISFNEPTLSLEWSLDIFPLARAKGLYNTYVTNGYMTPEALDLLIEAGLDAVNVDIKGSAEAVKKYCAADVEKVWRNCRAAREAGVWIEITTLVIPTVNDDEGILRSIARRIRDELGSETPWHVSGYYPAYQFTAPSTPVRTLERAHDIGVEEGLHFVYVGNVLGHRYEDTYCPDCGELLIQRFGLWVAQNRLEGARCPACQRLIPVKLKT